MAENRREFQQLARMRLKDARVLMRNGNLEAAYYLTGLAVECAVKACIAKNTRRYDFPPNQNAIKDIYTHDLAKLIRAAKLETALDTDRESNILFKSKWDVLKDWNMNSRYATGGLNARDLYAAVTGRNGVMQWLRQRW
jgi:HEPN domain-containing protein